MSKRSLILQCILSLFLANSIFGQTKLNDSDAFVHPIGNWIFADNVEMDIMNPEMLKFESGSECFVNGVKGKAKYLVTENEYQDMECEFEFIIPKGSNSGIYVQCRYEVQIFDSWGASNLTFYDCGGIQQRWDKNKPDGEQGFEGYAPLKNACSTPGTWQKLEFVFRAPKFNKKGDKIKNAGFEKVILNGIIVQENVELSGPTKGALSETEVAKAPFRLQGGHGPVAFRNIIVK